MTLDERTDSTAVEATEHATKPLSDPEFDPLFETEQVVTAADELASFIVPWDTSAEVQRIAATRGLPSDIATAERAIRLCRELNVPNAPGVVGWGPT